MSVLDIRTTPLLNLSTKISIKMPLEYEMKIPDSKCSYLVNSFCMVLNELIKYLKSEALKSEELISRYYNYKNCFYTNSCLNYS